MRVFRLASAVYMGACKQDPGRRSRLDPEKVGTYKYSVQCCGKEKDKEMHKIECD